MKPSATLLCKLGSIIVHADEMLSPKGHVFDKAALVGLLKDPEVVEWLGAMDAMAMIPKSCLGTDCMSTQARIKAGGKACGPRLRGSGRAANLILVASRKQSHLR